MLTNLTLENLLILVPVVLIAITFHELAHGWVAYQLGDPTPKIQGRLTLNPISHLDPLGALLLLVAGFGWAKPVEVNPYYFQGDRHKGMMLVALAGPLANILIAFIGALLFSYFGSYGSYAFIFFSNLVMINIYLAAFNLLPVPPLDGSKILAGLLPKSQVNLLFSLEGYGPLILMLLIITGFTRYLVLPIAKVLITLVWGLASFLVI
ncbi:MAG: peptidase [Peptococcaceae bacterium BICA1-8]|nr:MAG: peptidase [Peptococcaceae bacterium BICA1-8]